MGWIQRVLARSGGGGRDWEGMKAVGWGRGLRWGCVGRCGGIRQRVCVVLVRAVLLEGCSTYKNRLPCPVLRACRVSLLGFVFIQLSLFSYDSLASAPLFDLSFPYLVCRCTFIYIHFVGSVLDPYTMDTTQCFHLRVLIIIHSFLPRCSMCVSHLRNVVSTFSFTNFSLLCLYDIQKVNNNCTPCNYLHSSIVMRFASLVI